MKLEIKHLAPYLPYGLKMNYGIHCPVLCGLNNTDSIWLKYIDGYTREQHIGDYKPILRPLSDLTKPITHDGETFVPKLWLYHNYIGEQMGLNPATWSYRVIQKLIEWHFDVFGLIDAGLAININTLN